jgi:trehalose 6-phosphate synthase
MLDRMSEGRGDRGMDRQRLIIVSNRQPYEHRWESNQLVCARTDGELTAALDAMLQRYGGTWVAWGSGSADQDAVGPDMCIEVPPESPAYRLHRVRLTPDEVNGGCFGYANQVLWPLCHITLDRINYVKAFWPAYRSEMHRFSNAVLEELDREPGQVWIHDFHLALLPALIKAERPTAPVSVFWHIPWPSPDVWRILPERCEVLLGLLASDVIGVSDLQPCGGILQLHAYVPGRHHSLVSRSSVVQRSRNQGDRSPYQCGLSHDLRACGQFPCGPG